MLFTDKRLLKIFLISSVIAWVILLCITSVTALSSHPDMPIVVGNLILHKIFLSAFFLFVFLYYRVKNISEQSANFSEIIWQAFITGALMLFTLLITKQINISNADSFLVKDHFYINLVYDVNMVFIVVFTAKVFYVFKRMILYQRSRGLTKSWLIYEYLLLSCIILNLIFKEDIENSFVALLVIVSISTFGLVLSLNMRWVAYLNFKQKWHNLLLIFLILLITLTLALHIHASRNDFGSDIINDLAESVFIINCFMFICFYCISSMLVILFNFPTSSVFEQKMGEVFNFRKLSQTIQRIDEEDQIYDVLLDTCTSTSMADSAWLEIVDRKEEYAAFLNRNIDKYDVFELKKIAKRNELDFKSEAIYVKNLRKLKSADYISDMPFYSLMVVPLYSHGKNIGLIGLVKNVNDGFNKELIEIVKSFVGQASISIENSRLVADTVEHERYKEEIKIAKSVQRNLLPESLVYNSHFQISSFTESADEIGGDYYDSFKLDENRTAIVIADVSGHGTTAAFHMAQLKGVLQSLMLLDMPMGEMLSYANKALGYCLKKKTFITLSMYIIDTAKKQFSVARAGHCPTIYFDSETKTVEYLKNKGLGLGILRDDDFEKYIDIYTKDYNIGDVLYLYTDGIVEAKNSFGDELGYEKLKDIVSACVEKDTNYMVNRTIEELYGFCGDKRLDDDYTCLAIKFI